MTSIIIVCTIAIITVAALNLASAMKRAHEIKLLEAAQKVLGDKYDSEADEDILKIYRFIGEEHLQVQKKHSKRAIPSQEYHLRYHGHSGTRGY